MTISAALTDYVSERQRIEREATKPRFTYEIVSDDRQGGFFDPGYGVRNEQTGILMNEIPFQTERKAQSFIDDLENQEGAQ